MAVVPTSRRLFVPLIIGPLAIESAGEGTSTCHGAYSLMSTSRGPGIHRIRPCSSGIQPRLLGVAVVPTGRRSLVPYHYRISRYWVGRGKHLNVPRCLLPNVY